MKAVHPGVSRAGGRPRAALWVLAPAVLLPGSRWTLTLLPAYCLGALWSNLTNSFARNQPGYPLSDTHVGAINGLAQVVPLLWLFTGPLLFPVSVAGLAWVLVSTGAAQWRALGIAGLT